MKRTDIKSLTREELAALLTAEGEKPFRASQLYSWMHEKQVREYSEMTNLPLTLREKLAETCELTRLEIVCCQISRTDGTRKYAFRLADGNIIESVFMKYHYGSSVCVSSQVGCRMGCRFCASTLGGLVRNLTASEMLEQVYEIGRDTGERISHVVVMGMGEPLDNLDAVIRFLRILTDPKGAGLSQRNITVSTCGLVPQIDALAEEKFAITLAISLHAPNDALRRTMMPVANRYSIREILAACGHYFRKTGRRISFEYSLVAGVNDGPKQAAELAALLAGMNCHVNLIPVNPVRERDYREPTGVQVDKFKKDLEKRGINVTIRRRLGADIDSACGQLRRNELQKEAGDHA